MLLEIILGVVAALAIGLAAYALLRARPSDSAPQVDALRNDVNILRETNSKSIELIAKQVQSIAGQLKTSLEAVRADVGNRLDKIGQNMRERLNEDANAMRRTAKTVSDRIANDVREFASLEIQ